MSAAAVTGDAAVRIDDDLASRQARVAHGTTDHEPARRIDEEAQVVIDQIGWQHFAYDVRFDVLPKVIDIYLGVVLCRDHHRVDPLRAAVGVFDRDLRLAIGTQIGEQAALPHLGQAAAESVG